MIESSGVVFPYALITLPQTRVMFYPLPMLTIVVETDVSDCDYDDVVLYAQWLARRSCDSAGVAVEGPMLPVVSWRAAVEGRRPRRTSARGIQQRQRYSLPKGTRIARVKSCPLLTLSYLLMLCRPNAAPSLGYNCLLTKFPSNMTFYK